MRTEHFHRDKYYAARMRPGEADPFDVRVFDYRLQRALPRLEAEQLTNAVLSIFDSFSAAIAREGSEVGQAYYKERRQVACYYSEIEALRLLPADRESARRSHLALIDLFGGELATFSYFVSWTENATVLRIVCSHFAMDQVTHALVGRFVSGYVAGGRVREKSGPNYLDWMAAYHQYSTGAAGRREVEFWKNYSVDAFEEVRRGVASCPREAGVRATYRLPSAAVMDLRDICRRLRCRMTDVVSVQTLLALGAEYGLERIPVNWTAHGRYPIGGHNFVATAGWLGDRHPLLVPLTGSSIDALTEAFRHAIAILPVWGNAFGWVNRFAEDGGLEESFISPFILNVQESAPTGPRLPEGGVLSFEPFSRLGVPPRIYVVVSVGSSVKITMECAGGVDPEACKRIARRLEENYETMCQAAGV